MRFTFLLLAVVVLQAASWPVCGRAATPSPCSAYIDTFAMDLQTNTTTVDELARPGDPSADHIAQSAARYNRDADNYSRLCPASRAMYVDALLTAWKAWLEHATTHTNPVQTVELAARKLEQCTVTYNGTDDGATCATWAKQVAKWQDEWASP